MSDVRFVVFHTGVEALATYLPLMRVSRDALKATNPGARYVVLTDKKTAPHLDKEFEVEAVAPSGWPLMRQFVAAQRAYETTASGLVILAGSDCVANRPLTDATNCGFATTYRLQGKGKINNIAYVRDHDLAVWFLDRAMGCMDPGLEDFWGDQQSWESALGPFDNWQPLDDRPEGLRVVNVEGRSIHLYPCRTHNYFPKRSGALNLTALKSYVLHYKGTRKLNMIDSVNWYILGRGNPPSRDKISEERPTLPMEERRSGCARYWSVIQGIGDKS